MTHEILDTMGHGHQVFTGNVQETFRSLPLPIRMREAAKVLEDVARRFQGKLAASSRTAWANDELRTYADRWEAEDRAKAEQDAMVEELARDLYTKTEWSGCDGSRWDRMNDEYREPRRVSARRLYESGWRKGGSDE